MNNRHFRAPLNFDRQKFERGYKSKPKYCVPPILIATALKILYIFLLLSIDLVLFTGSGNLDIFYGGFLLSSELMILLGLSLAASTVLMALSAFSKWLQNGICALATFWFVLVLFNQFSQFDNDTFLGNFFAGYAGDWVPAFFYHHSAEIFAIIVASIVLWFLFNANLIALAIYNLLFLIAFVGILRNEYCSTRNQHDFIELYQSQIKNNAQTHGKKFIYMMLPGMSSYKYFAALDTPDAREAEQIAVGFYAKNKFEVFPNAYNKNNNPFMNMVSSLNTFSDDEPENHIMDTMMLYRYWKFFNVSDEYVFLKDNQMFDAFRKSGYKISAYKSRGFDLCHKQHRFNVDRCIEKLNHPVNLYSMNASTLERTQLLLIEWLNSMRFFNNMSGLYQAVKFFSNAEYVPLVGVNYNNLYVINSLKTFDVLADNIKEDKGSQAYFVYADIPSDMFIYDQYCSLKPRSEWITADDLPWVYQDNSSLKRRAYIEQTKCLYGKLQEFLDILAKENLQDKSVLIINGMSGTNNFQSVEADNFVNDMIYDKLTTLAIKSPAIKTFKINEEICESNGILRHYLYQDSACHGLNEINIHFTLKDELVSRLNALSVSQKKALADISVFEKWYADWRRYNNIKLDDKADILTKNPWANKKEKSSNLKHEQEAPDLRNKTLQMN